MTADGLLAGAVGLLIPAVALVAVIAGVMGAVRSSPISGSSKRQGGREKVRLTRGRKAVILAAGLIVLAAPIHLAAWGGYGYFVVEPEFKREVHGHTVNAYWANTPELMIAELRQARSGMAGFGLEGNEYSSILTWEQTPDNRMDYQYALIDSVIERAEAVKADRDRQQQQGTSDQLGDVYETKMDNLRDFIGPNSDGGKSGWLDETAHGAFVIEKHPYVAWWAAWGVWTIIPWLAAIGACAGALFIPNKQEDGVPA